MIKLLNWQNFQVLFTTIYYYYLLNEIHFTDSSKFCEIASLWPKISVISSRDSLV